MHCAPFLLTMQIIFASVSYRRVVADLRMTKGMINPTITKADTFASAIPSTLFPAYAKIIIAATTLSIVANMDMINVVYNDISDTEQKESSTKETMAANKTGIINLDIR